MVGTLDRKSIRLLIETSASVEQANWVIERYTDLKSYEEKITFLKGMFDCKVINATEQDPAELIYELMLHAIITTRWD